jgi:hypothetical protein
VYFFVSGNKKGESLVLLVLIECTENSDPGKILNRQAHAAE